MKLSPFTLLLGILCFRFIQADSPTQRKIKSIYQNEESFIKFTDSIYNQIQANSAQPETAKDSITSPFSPTQTRTNRKLEIDNEKTKSQLDSNQIEPFANQSTLQTGSGDSDKSVVSGFSQNSKDISIPDSKQSGSSQSDLDSLSSLSSGAQSGLELEVDSHKSAEQSQFSKGSLSSGFQSDTVDQELQSKTSQDQKIMQHDLVFEGDSQQQAESSQAFADQSLEMADDKSKASFLTDGGDSSTSSGSAKSSSLSDLDEDFTSESSLKEIDLNSHQSTQVFDLPAKSNQSNLEILDTESSKSEMPFESTSIETQTIQVNSDPNQLDSQIDINEDKPVDHIQIPVPQQKSSNGGVNVHVSVDMSGPVDQKPVKPQIISIGQPKQVAAPLMHPLSPMFGINGLAPQTVMYPMVATTASNNGQSNGSPQIINLGNGSSTEGESQEVVSSGQNIERRLSGRFGEPGNVLISKFGWKQARSGFYRKNLIYV